MKSFQITIRTVDRCLRYQALAATSSQAMGDAAELLGDEPCGITVVSLG
jgi:hypothetical protein